MLDQAMELFRRLIGILIATFDIAYTLIYYAYATIIYSTGAVFLLLCWCAFCALTQSVADHVPIKRWTDRRLQDKFLRKVKNMGYQELNMRARLINVGEDIKMRNEANNQILKEICDAGNFIMRKVKYYEPEFRTGRYDIQPVIPGMFIPPHPTPAAPSPFAIVRWWFSQDYDSHRLECSIAGFSTQLTQNKQRLKALDQESESLKLELTQALERKRQVRHEPTLPNYKQMYRNFDEALETMRTLRHNLPLHQCTYVCTCPQEAAPSYPEWLVPPKRLRRWEWGLLAPGQSPPRVTSLPDVGSWSAPPAAPALSQPPPAAATPFTPATLVSLPALYLPPLFGPPPPAAPVRPVTPPPPPPTSLSPAERLRDPAGVRARAPTPPPPASPRSSRPHS
ncbi:hypothetical protein INS49_002126 [Diaporthe citri]|uniref:uncharacterized protein n=1 Tax=Diaporthe citri TaxID=83186 RepID=UPI001C8104F7|nr:uncharacterized protein INS49_002126 [Diaporthe citri]KAG6367926.1 hypothetical protein INS49_002126 [Diaporthe citri]